MTGCSDLCDRCDRCRDRSRPRKRPRPLPCASASAGSPSRNRPAAPRPAPEFRAAWRIARPFPQHRARRMRRGLGQLAQPDNQQPLGRQAGRGMQQHGLIRAGFVLAGREHAAAAPERPRRSVSSVGCGLASGPLAVCVSTARTASSSVAMPAIGAKESSVRILPILHGPPCGKSRHDKPAQNSPQAGSMTKCFDNVILNKLTYSYK